MSINRAIISGNLTRDAELRATASGTPIMSLGVAVNDRRKNQQSGEWEDYCNYIDCVMFGSRAQSLSNYLKKGTKVSIEGKLRWSQWESRDGQKRSKIEVIIDEIEFMSSRNNGSQSSADSYGSSSYSNDAASNNDSSRNSAQDSSSNASGTPSVDTSSSVYDEDIPF